MPIAAVISCLFTRRNGSMVLPEGLVRRRVQEEEPDDEQQRDDHEQEDVDVTDRPALVRVHASRDEIHQSSDAPSWVPGTGRDRSGS